MKRTIIALSSLLLGVHTLFGQDQAHTQTFDRYEKINVASPEAMSFEKVSLIPNDLSTGKLGLTIPIFNAQSGRLSYPIYLSYNSGGIKVDEQASEVGLGWSLSKTMITRNIIDGNDFNNVGNQHLDPVGGGFAIGSDEYFDHINATIKFVGYFLKKKNNILAGPAPLNNVDEMPDMYNLISNDGFQTKFYFKDENTPKELTEKSSVISATKTKENYSNPYYTASSSHPHFPMYDFTKIEVTSNRGIKYTFENYDVIRSISINFPGLAGIYTHYSSAPQISTWYISKIEDLITGDEITFTYEQYNADPYEDYAVGPTDPPGLLSHHNFRTMPGNTFINALNNCPGRVYGSSGVHNGKLYARSNSSTRYIVKNRLKQINFKTGKVVFTWNGDRQDMYNEKILDKITIYDTSTGTDQFVKDYDLFQGYFDSGCGDPYKCKRLKLAELKETGKPSYKFSYDSELGTFPKITSRKEDYFGYNNSAVNVVGDEIKMPTLYFYPGKADKSILPFIVPNNQAYTIPGDFSAVSTLNDIRKWTLNKVEYPTGATSEIEYELNKVNIFNNDKDASGLRVASQTIKDENNIARKIDYEYLQEDGKSSGTFVNVPIYGRPVIGFSNPNTNVSQWNNNQLYKAFVISQEPKVESDLTRGNYISYSRVVEKEFDNGYTVNKFISNEMNINGYNRVAPTQAQLNLFTYEMCNANSMINNSAFALQFYTDNSFKRGQLLSKKIFDKNDNPRQETINEYSENQGFYTDTYTKRFFQLRRNADGGSVNDYENIVDVSKTYTQNTFKLVKTTTKDYLNSGDVSTEKEFVYNDIGDVSFLLSKDNLNKTTIDRFIYSYDTTTQDFGLPKLISSNYLSFLMETEKTRNIGGSQIYVSGKLKELNTDGTINKILSRDMSSEAFREDMQYESYLNYKPTQVKDRSGKVTSFVWSGDYLIAKIENETYANIKNTASNNFNTDIENCNTSNCNNVFAQLRTYYPLAKITSYTYDNPLIGVSSITDPRGETVFYYYNSINALEFVKDANGKIVNKYEYNFKN